MVSTGDGVSGVARRAGAPADDVDIAPAQDADLDDPQDRAANVSAQSASVPPGHDASPSATLFDTADDDTADDTDDTRDGKGE